MRNLIFILVLGMAFSICSCEKKEPEPENLLNRYPDSILIGGGWKVKFVYDADKRVAEERLFKQDTLYEHWLYDYTGNATLPVKRTYFYRDNPNPLHASIYQYDNIGRKLLDSVIHLGQGVSTKTTFNYYAAGRIAIHKEANIIQDDTVYLAANGNIDSIRTYYTYYNNPKFLFRTTWFSQFDNNPNVFSQLNISEALFYSHVSQIITVWTPIINYKNQNNVLHLSHVHNNIYFSGERNEHMAFQYNQDNLPEMVTSQNDYNPGSLQYRFVYTN